jgi:hypothetical protein
MRTQERKWFIIGLEMAAGVLIFALAVIVPAIVRYGTPRASAQAAGSNTYPNSSCASGIGCGNCNPIPTVVAQAA